MKIALWIWSIPFIIVGSIGMASHSLLVGIWVLPFIIAASNAKGRQKYTAAYQHMVRELSEVKQTPLTRVRAAYFFVGLPMFVLCLANGRNIASYDNYGIQMTTVSLLQHGTADFSRISGHRKGQRVDCTLKTTYPLICSEKGVFAATPSGMLLFSLPLFGIAKLLGSPIEQHRIQWRMAKWSAAWFTSLALTLFFVVGIQFGNISSSLIAAILMGTGSALLSTAGQGLWSHTGVMFGLLLGLWAVFEIVPRSPHWGTWILGFSFSVMIACRLTSLFMVLLFFLWFTIRKPKLWTHLFLSFGIGVALFLSYNFEVYGTFLGAQFLAATQSKQGTFSAARIPIGIYGLLLSPGTGLLIYQPWLWITSISIKNFYSLLSIDGIKKTFSNMSIFFWRNGNDLKCTFIFMFLSQLFLFSTFIEWSGQYCWGTRYLTESIPLLALLAIPVIHSRMNKEYFLRLVCFLGLIGGLIHFNGAFLTGGQWSNDPLPEAGTMQDRALDWTDPAFLYPIPRWFYDRQT